MQMQETKETYKIIFPSFFFSFKSAALIRLFVLYVHYNCKRPNKLKKKKKTVDKDSASCQLWISGEIYKKSNDYCKVDTKGVNIF